IILNRPEIHNAFNSTVISEMSVVFGQIAYDNSLRAVVLTGEGKSFCAGADLNWMKSVKEQGFDKNLKESISLADLFYQIHTCKLPVIGRINGAAIGGGTGFVALCDIAIAANSAVFSFSEVKIGLVPACIGPYVIKKMGEGRARELFISGERMSAERALQVGLVNQVVDDNQLDNAVNELLNLIMSSGPNAVAMAKKLINEVPAMSPEQFRPYTAELIARLRVSEEGQEGMDSFLNKRKPKWTEET
ncbi:MAG: enoyl-CoA hydratase-related protein, partial [Candidatus Zixiibacteriota bacterium]